MRMVPNYVGKLPPLISYYNRIPESLTFLYLRDAARWRTTINIFLNVRPLFSRVSLLQDIKYEKIHYKISALVFLLKLLKSLKGI